MNPVAIDPLSTLGVTLVDLVHLAADLGREQVGMTMVSPADGPTWMCSAEDSLGPPPFGTMPRREAVLPLSRRAMRDEGR